MPCPVRYFPLDRIGTAIALWLFVHGLHGIVSLETSERPGKNAAEMDADEMLAIIEDGATNKSLPRHMPVSPTPAVQPRLPTLVPASLDTASVDELEALIAGGSTPRR